MSSNIDPAKLKVVDLRNELATRGLDQKGNKAVLVKRLKDALEKESGSELPDTSFADTTTEDLDTSQPEEPPRKSLRKSTDEKEELKPARSASAIATSPEKAKPPTKSPEKVVTPQEKPAPAKPTEASKPATVSKPVAAPKPTASSPIQPANNTEVKSSTTVPESPKAVVKPPEKPVSVVKTPEKPKTGVKPPENAKSEVKTPEKPTAEIKKPENPKTEVKTPEKPKTEVKTPEKSKTEVKTVTQSPTKTDKLGEANGEQVDKEAPMEVQEESEKSEKPDEDKSEGAENDTDQKGEKRKRSSDSPERAPKRARTPPREDEPTIDVEAVQISWCDSDLHLQVDKSTFLSAKPLTEGAFGYVWAGARASHGISSGKVCYEVKITESLKWDDFARPSERFRTDHRRGPRRDDRRHSRKSENKDGKKDDEENSKDKSEKTGEGEKKEDGSENKEATMEVTESVESDERSKGEMKETDKAQENATKPDEPMETESEDKKPEGEENKDSKKDAEEEKKEGEEEKKEGEEEKKEGEEEKKEGDEEKKDAEKDTNDGEAEKKDSEEEGKAKEKPEEPPLPSHFIRIGWSVLSSSLQLGEDKHSFAYESSGQFVKDKEFKDYGVTFDADAVIGAYLDISEDTVTLRFSVNGELQPAVDIPKSELPENFVLYPHILSRNYAFEVNFGEKEEPWFSVPSELAGYQFISKVENKLPGRVRPESRSDCEVLLMCGLPASGKTHWVREHTAANPDKNYTVLGNTSILERMTVSGEPLKSKFKGRWGILIDRVQKCLNRLVSTAALRRRNYIIDQTNVYASAQRRKLRPFEGFKRKAVIVVVGEEEQARRQGLQEALEGKEVPDSTILGMKAAMMLPETGDWLEEVSYVGVEETEAKEIVKKYNEAGKAAGFSSEKRYNRENRWSYNRRDDQGRNYSRGGGYRQPYPPSGGRRDWQPPHRREGGGGGGWKQDSRSREWRGSGYDQRSSRDYYNQGGYDRSRNQSGGRSGGWGGSSGGGGGGGGWGGRNQGGGGGSWNQQATFGGARSHGQGWSGGSGGSWGKYGSGSGGSGQGQNYGGYNNYYGQQQQGNWSQGQQQQWQQWQQQQQQQRQQQPQQQHPQQYQQAQQYAGYSNNASATAAQGQQSSQQAYSTQEAWAQYARQYAQHQQMTQAAAAAAQKR